MSSPTLAASQKFLLTEEGGKQVLRVPKGKVLTDPLELVFAEPKTRLEIVVGEGAKAEVIALLKDEVQEHTAEIFVSDNADVRFTSLLQGGAECRIDQQAKVGAHAKLHICNATFGGSVEQSLVSCVCGASSESSVDWIFSAQDAETQKLSVKNIFDAPNGRGKITVKGVAEDKAHVKCDGMIEITEKGSGTDTYLTEKMLMLDATARCDAVPALEIRTNDVRASHSATVTKINPEDLFYLNSRGLQEQVARQIIVEGFLVDLADRFPSSVLDRFLQRVIQQKQQHVVA